MTVRARTAGKATTASAPVKSAGGGRKAVAEYLAAAPKDKRDALMALRRTIKAAAPTATEAMSYGIVGFKHAGKPLVYIGYAKAHCALYGANRRFLEPEDVKGYEQSKGTIRFTPDKPLPERLVRKIVKARIAEITGSR